MLATYRMTATKVEIFWIEEVRKHLNEVWKNPVVNFRNLLDSKVFSNFASTANFLQRHIQEYQSDNIQDALDYERLYRTFIDFEKCLEEKLMTIVHKQSSSNESYMDRWTGLPDNSPDLTGNKLYEFLNNLKYDDSDNIAALFAMLLSIRSEITSIHDSLESHITIDAVEQNFRKFVEEDLGVTEQKLKVYYKQFRQKVDSGRSREECWSVMFGEIIKIQDLAIKGNGALVDNIEYNDLYNKSQRQALEKGSDIIKVVKQTSVEDELFSFSKSNTMYHLLSKLTGDNLYAFFLMVHTENLIKCHIYSDLEKQYELFLTPPNLRDFMETELNPESVICFSNEDKIKKAKSYICEAFIAELKDKDIKDYLMLFIVMKDHGVTDKILSKSSDFCMALVKWKLFPKQTNDERVEESDDAAIHRLKDNMTTAISSLRKKFNKGGRNEVPGYKIWKGNATLSYEYDLCEKIAVHFKEEFPYKRAK